MLKKKTCLIKRCCRSASVVPTNVLATSKASVPTQMLSKEDETALLLKYREEPLPPGWKVYLSRSVRGCATVACIYMCMYAWLVFLYACAYISLYACTYAVTEQRNQKRIFVEVPKHGSCQTRHYTYTRSNHAYSVLYNCIITHCKMYAVRGSAFFLAYFTPVLTMCWCIHTQSLPCTPSCVCADQ